MTLDVSNVSRIQIGFKFIINPDPDPIIEYVLSIPFSFLNLILRLAPSPYWWTDFADHYVISLI